MASTVPVSAYGCKVFFMVGRLEREGPMQALQK